MKPSKRNQNYLKVVGGKLAELVNEHPEQTIQEQWMKWLDEEGYTYEGYVRFMDWRNEWLKLNPID